MKLDRAIEAVTELVSDVDLTFLEDYIGNLLPVYGLEQTVKRTIDYLKVNPGYPKVVHRRIRRRDLANAHLEDSGDEENDEYATYDGEQANDSDVDDGKGFGGHESGHEGNEDGVSDDGFKPYAEDEVSDEEQGSDGNHVLEVPECGCCFSQIPAGDDVVLCPVKHPFCLQCLVSHASVQLGEQKSILKCMDTSGCDQAFSDRELRHHLPDKLIQLYDNVSQERELREANIPGLVRCPLCPYACVMEMSIEEEPLFKCHNLKGECGKTTCRMCRKVDHRPFGCDQGKDEVERLAVEEAMTRALIRNCPRCNNAFIREEDGCNKMTCPSCHTMSCYVCRQAISIEVDYRHFYNNEKYSPDGRCPLWDTQPLHELHAQEVHAAYEGALAEQALAVRPHEGGRLAVEEAMTRALMRNCPRCNSAFIKEDGCNNMTCPSCKTSSCYVCRQAIEGPGYDHFYNNERFDPDGRCPLWDTQPLHELHAQEVQGAYEGALAEQAFAAPPQPGELAHDAWDFRLLVGEEEFERGLVAHPRVNPEVAAARPVAFEEPEHRNLNGRQLIEGDRREVRNAPAHAHPGFVAARDARPVIEQPQALVRAHARAEVQAQKNLQRLDQEMDRAMHAAHLAGRRAKEAQKRVDEVRGREKLYYRMLNAGYDVHPEHVFCFHYPPGLKRIMKTRDGYNPKPERKAREAHLQFALDDERRFNQASEEAYRRFTEARAALRLRQRRK